MAPRKHEHRPAKPVAVAANDQQAVAARASSPSHETTTPPAAPSAAAAVAKAQPAAGAHTFAAAFADGEQLLRSGDVAGALARYQEAARLNPTDAKTQRQIVKCYNRLGQRDRAVPFIKRYLELAPDASDADFYRAQLDGK
jgi:Flp pilus assembly protein TadD